ncbi:hypothetical protein [Treponema sp.]|uniref:hypothetical protein n=1 Tax=Treponema sp. TaxID=166 RepID=UPI00298D896B|nr:hypothetical protein [Treponema sp.]
MEAIFMASISFPCAMLMKVEKITITKTSSTLAPARIICGICFFCSVAFFCKSDLSWNYDGWRNCCKNGSDY